MKEQFVSYEIAIKLKEKGFMEECFGFYYYDASFKKYRLVYEESSNDYLNSINAPLWQQVIDWLREKHFIDIMIRQTKNDGTAYYKITKIETEDKIKGYSNFCNTVNSARQSAIEHALTLI